MDRLQARTAHKPQQCSKLRSEPLSVCFCAKHKGICCTVETCLWHSVNVNLPSSIYRQNANAAIPVSGLFVAQFEPLVRSQFVDCSLLFGVIVIPANMHTNARFMLHYCRGIQVCTSFIKNKECHFGEMVEMPYT